MRLGPLYVTGWWREPFIASGLWFRVGASGWGLHLSTKKRRDALFSERYGFRKVLYVLGLRIEVLRPR